MKINPILTTLLLSGLSFGSMAALHTISGTVDTIRYHTFTHGVDNAAEAWQGHLWFSVHGRFESGACQPEIYLSGEDDKAFELLKAARINHLVVNAYVSDTDLFRGHCRLQLLEIAPATQKTTLSTHKHNKEM